MARRIGAGNREAERRIQDALTTRIGARFERSYRREITRVMRAMAGGDIDAQMQEHRDNLERMIRGDYTAAAEAAGERLLDAAAQRHGRHALQVKQLPDVFREAVALFIRRWTATKVTQVSSTTREQVTAMIRRGEEQGLGVDAIARTIRDSAPSIAAVRAHVIARTETHFATGFGHQAAAEASGIDLRKEWITATDGREREAHNDADRQTVGMRERFDVDGELLMYPGDADGSPENIINCRCASGYMEP